MKTLNILYAIQGTGNGHLSRARDIIPILQQKGKLDILVSGTQADVELPYPIKYRCNGLSFIFGKKGGVDLVETYKKGNLKKLISEVKNLPILEYDLVINDFEPVSAWACYFKGKECISLSHQSAVLYKDSPKPKKNDLIGKIALKRYAPSTANYGFHFKKYGEHIYTPVIRKEIREIKVENSGHYTVYLPAYSDKKIIKFLSEFPEITWEVFSKHTVHPYQEGNIFIHCIQNESFIRSLATAEGVFCGAGFETPAESLFLKKKLLVVPMKNQYEQQCNAKALKEMGIPVINNLKRKQIPVIKAWLNSTEKTTVDYPDYTQEVIDLIFSNHPTTTETLPVGIKGKSLSMHQFRNLITRKI